MTLEELMHRPIKSTTTDKGTVIQQTVRNNFRNDVLDLFLPMLQEYFASHGIDTVVVRSPKGIMFEFPHEDIGAIPIELLIQMKPLDTDVYEYEEAYNDAATKRAEKAKAKQAAVAKVKEA